METNPTERRLSFLIDCASGQWSMSELCERYRVSRPTGYKWLRWFEQEGERGLFERARTPKSCSHQTAPPLVKKILQARAKYGWGAKKLLQVLRVQCPAESWPARSTINAILDRHGKLHKQRRRRQWTHPGAAPLVTERPNQVWPVDFKG
jgi:transposase